MMYRPGLTTLATIVVLLLISSQHAFGEREPAALTPTSQPEIYRDSWIDFNKNGSRDVYEDTAAPVDARIQDLLSQMTVTEKACQLATLYGYQRVLKDDLPTEEWREEVWKDGIANIDEHINGLAGWRGKPESEYVSSPTVHARAMNEVQRWFVEQTRLGIPVDFTNEGLRGLNYLRATNFPAQVGVGATWNPALVQEIGRVTGTEARAVGYTNIYSPVLDIACDPRWGRVVECYGEDPFLVGRLGTAQAQGLREAKVGSTLKHFAVYSVPKGGRDGEARTDPHVAPREMQQIFLEPFATVIREADPVGVMCSYNDYDGVPLAANQNLLIDELRGRMGFRGYVVSDSNAVANLWDKHRVAASHQEAVRLFLESGGNVRTEFNSPEKFIRDVLDLVEQQRLAIDLVDERVRDVLRVKMELGLFDQPFVEQTERADELVNCEAHSKVALEAARQSMVLLKNEKNVLPLAKNLSSILVCGPNAASTGHSICRYGPVLGEVISVVDGIRAVVSDETEVKYAIGCEIIDKHWPESEILPAPRGDDEQALIDEAVELAAGVDAIVLVLGESEHTIGESKSRTSLELTGYQNDLAKALHATGKPVVVVLINGRALAINWIDRYVPAVIDAWFPGQACGQAVAEVLFGDYNPGGKLPVTFPRTVGQVPFSFPYKPGSHAGPGKGHNPNGIGNSHITGSLYPFGFGLSYTDFEYSDLVIASKSIAPDESVQVTCRVTNVGKRTGDEVVQLYLRDDVSSVTTYDSVLRGFERITLKPGESRQVSFTLAPASLELINQDMQRVVEPGSFTVMVGSSSEDLRLKGSFQVRGEAGDVNIAAKHVQN